MSMEAEPNGRLMNVGAGSWREIAVASLDIDCTHHIRHSNQVYLCVGGRRRVYSDASGRYSLAWRPPPNTPRAADSCCAGSMGAENLGGLQWFVR